jgi:hypothetical protein
MSKALREGTRQLVHDRAARRHPMGSLLHKGPRQYAFRRSLPIPSPRPPRSRSHWPIPRCLNLVRLSPTFSAHRHQAPRVCPAPHPTHRPADPGVALPHQPHRHPLSNPPLSARFHHRAHHHVPAPRRRPLHCRSPSLHHDPVRPPPTVGFGASHRGCRPVRRPTLSPQPVPTWRKNYVPGFRFFVVYCQRPRPR